MAKKKVDLYSKIYSAKTLKKIEDKILLLGIDCNYDAVFLLNIRFISSISLFFVVLYFIDFGYLIAPLITALFYFLFFPFVLDRKIKKRSIKLEKEAVYFFEVLCLSLEAGRSIRNSLDVTVHNVDSELSREFNQVLVDVSLGKSLNEALDALRKRIPSDTINNVVLNIKESNIFGNSIIETLYNQIDYIREKRILRAKAQISKIPVKVSVISVVFYIPLLLLLLLAPMIIKFIK